MLLLVGCELQNLSIVDRSSMAVLVIWGKKGGRVVCMHGRLVGKPTPNPNYLHNRVVNMAD